MQVPFLKLTKSLLILMILTLFSCNLMSGFFNGSPGPLSLEPTPQPTQAPLLEGTPAPLPTAIYFLPESLKTTVGEEFSLDLYIDLGEASLATYRFAVSYDQGIIELNTAEGDNGITVKQGAVENVTKSTATNRLFITGEVAPGSNDTLIILTLHWQAIAAGECPLALLIQDFTTHENLDLSTVSIEGATVTVE